jgi:hypothetical protein
VSSGWQTWIGYREVWPLAERRRFCFGSADLTVFGAPAGSEAFQQLLRAEWAGLLKCSDNTWAFRPADAGHPHWQVDIAEALREDRELASARDLLRETAPRDFEGSAVAEVTLPPWYEIGRMHFASAMRPWSDANIAHGPRCLADINGWVLATIGVLGVELDRL